MIILYLYTNMRTMDKSALKSSLHHFIEQINNRHLLEDYYHEMKNIVKMTDQNAWDSLTDAQKKEVLMSWQESEDDNNLVDHNIVMARYKEWL
jgi:hypothetical protein